MLYKDLSKKIRSVVAIHTVSQLRFLFGASIHNRFLIKAKAEAGETYSKITENACVYKKFLNTKGI